MSILKTCTKCNKTKPLSEYYKDKQFKDGYTYHCKACLKAYKRKYHKRNAEKIREKVRRWQQDNPDKVSERYARYRRRYPEKTKARSDVSNAVKLGKLPHISTRTCVNCGAQADHYHHHNGYGRKHRLDVVPMCQTCHFEEDGIL